MIMFTEAERHLVQLALERAAQSEEAKADMIKPASATREIRRQVKAWRKIAKAMDPKPIKPALGYRRRLARIKAETVATVAQHRRLLPPGECAYCDREREAGNIMFPSHDASSRCESGKRSHCTCDTCF